MRIPTEEEIVQQLDMLLDCAAPGKWAVAFRSTRYRVYVYLSRAPVQPSLVAVEVFKDIQNPDKDKPFDFIVWSGNLDSSVQEAAECASQSLQSMLNKTK